MAFYQRSDGALLECDNSPAELTPKPTGYWERIPDPTAFEINIYRAVAAIWRRLCTAESGWAAKGEELVG